MNKDIFEKRKENLLIYTNDFMQDEGLSNTDKISIKKLLKLLNEYSFENRLEKKGLLTRTIIDSLELDYSLGGKFIEFDNTIR